MPRRVTTRSVGSARGWPAKSDQLARAFAPFSTDAIAHVASGEGSRGASVKSSRGDADLSTRVAVAANLHDVVGLQVFTLTPQAAANLEVDDALLQPYI